MKLNFDELVKQKTINLSFKGLDDNDLEALYKVIENSTVIETLNLGGNYLTLTDGKLANAIANNTTLQCLDLFENIISLEGVKRLAKSLNKNSTLKILGLDRESIGDEGAKYIADMLVVNKSLQKIELSSNNIGDQGAQSLATSLVVNTGIRKIWLRDNKIGDQGAQKLADALESNHSLNSIEYLEFYGNNISKILMDRIKAILDDDKRGDNVPQSCLDKLELFIAKKDAAKNKEIAKKDKKLKGKDLDIARKDKQIASMKSVIRSQVKQQRGQLRQLESFLDPVDLTTEEDESAKPPNKRARTGEDTPKSTLAIQHESIKEAVKVKEENINDYVSFLQSKIDELATVAEAGGADKDKVAEIKGRLRLNFDEFVSATAMTNMG